MLKDDDDALDALIPRPREFARHPGHFVVHPETRIRSTNLDPRVERSARRWLQTRNANGNGSKSTEGIHIAIDPQVVPQKDGYRLIVNPSSVDLVGSTDAGCFYGLQTLYQLTGDENAILCCTIRDWPDFTTRGLLHDISRGKVPNIGTLKLLVDRLAGWKCNQLQLYIEHSLTFEFDPTICGPDDGLTHDEVRELDAHCKERFIDLVPAAATLGHMGRILSLPQYRHLAEIEATESWADMEWPKRARGFTLDVLNPDSRELVARIWKEILAAFSSPVVNLCGDEPWDLGKGKNKTKFNSDGAAARAYLEHIAWTHAIVANAGRRAQAWSDVIKNHPELFHLIPSDIAILHWGYDDTAEYNSTSKFVQAGLETICCPGTSGWKRIFNALNLSERNIAAFAAAGKKSGATGVINTDWGDHGHFNSLACSWHPIALAAALAWNVEHPTGEEFDLALARNLWGISDDSILADLREASRIADRVETWRLFWIPLRQAIDDRMLPTIELADRSSYAAMDAFDALNDCTASDDFVSDDFNELKLTCRCTQLFAEKIAAAQKLRVQLGDVSTPAASRRRNFTGNEVSEMVSDFAHDYGDAWRRRNKLSGLWDILTVLARVSSEMAATQMSPAPHQSIE